MVKNRTTFCLFFLFSFIFNFWTFAEEDLIDLVNPMIGTGGHGHTFPGVFAPFGLVQLSPDTRVGNWDAASGYHFSDDTLMGFSHTHLSGTGALDLADILVMPQYEDNILWNPQNDYVSGKKWRTHFSHEDEVAKAGHYFVDLKELKIKVNLTATQRVGFHRYNFYHEDENSSPSLLIDLNHNINRENILELHLKKISDYEIAGYRRTKGWAPNQRVYFVLKSSLPISKFLFRKDGRIIENLNEITGKNIALALIFPKKTTELMIKVALSNVDIDGARKNLEAEVPGFNFEKVKNEAQNKWRETLSKIKVSGGERDDQIKFYTALYHTYVAPYIFQDVDGRYRGHDDKIYQNSEKDTHYTLFSLWDTFRSFHPLMNILEPTATNDFIKTFLKIYQQRGHLPIWELWGNDTYCMIGQHAIPVIVDAYMKGLRDYDVNLAYKAIKEMVERDYRGLNYFRNQGYIPSDGDRESVSKTLEYSFNAWNVAVMAKDLGYHTDSERYFKMAQHYVNLLDPETGLMRPRRNGQFHDPFDPKSVDHHYTEANAWQYSFFVPHDVDNFKGYLKENNFELDQMLETLFTLDSNTTGNGVPDVTGLIGQYAHGNEPSHQTSYLYHYTGKPYLAIPWLNKIMKDLYLNAPDGLSGNEDAGQMSAWYILSSMGFHPMALGNLDYMLGLPLFDKVEISGSNGESFVIERINGGGENIYPQEILLNGMPLNNSYINHPDILAGGTLTFIMGSLPNINLGRDMTTRPKSSIYGKKLLATPAIKGKTPFNTTENEITISSVNKNALIYYTLDGSEPNPKSRETYLYTGPFKIKESCDVKARAFPKEEELSLYFESFTEKSTIRKSQFPFKITYKTPYSDTYSGKGDSTLFDGEKGGSNYLNGLWLGFWGTDEVELELDLGEGHYISSVGINFLEDVGVWIFPPKEIHYSYSYDGKNFIYLGSTKHKIPLEMEEAKSNYSLLKDLKIYARYIGIKALNAGVLPEWHPGAGKRSWIFFDEVLLVEK